MTRLSVNINKVATLRNARGGNAPDLINVALDCERFGAEGITVHPRPDERHIRYQDVIDLKRVITTELNIEGNPNDRFTELVLSVKPAQVTLVPDADDALTSSAGWVVRGNEAFLRETIARYKAAGIRTSLFVGTELENIEQAAQVGADRIELYTEPYASHYPHDHVAAVAPFAVAARYATSLGLEVNAGHDLSLDNIAYLHHQAPEIVEVSIGHALICEALYQGLEPVIKQYLQLLK